MFGVKLDGKGAARKALDIYGKEVYLPIGKFFLTSQFSINIPAVTNEHNFYLFGALVYSIQNSVIPDSEHPEVYARQLFSENFLSSLFRYFTAFSSKNTLYLISTQNVFCNFFQFYPFSVGQPHPCLFNFFQ